MYERGRHRKRRGGRPSAELIAAGGHTSWQDDEGVTEGVAGPAQGPFDEADAPPDEVSRLNLGSVRLPVPEDAQLQVEVDQSGVVAAVHVLTERGQLTVNAFAAPRSEGLWAEVAPEIIEQLRTEGAQVSEVEGEWGREVDAITAQTVIRFVGIDGPRWMLRGVAAGPAEQFGELLQLLYETLRGTVVVRGAEPMPVRSPLPLSLPEPMAEQLKQAAAAQGQQWASK